MEPKLKEKVCLQCHKHYMGVTRSKFCCDACKQAAYRNRNKNDGDVSVTQVASKVTK